jgi:hypothetical protein
MELIDQLKAKGYTLKRIELECNMPARTLQPGRKIPSKYMDKLISMLGDNQDNKPLKETINTSKASHWVDKYGLIRYLGEDGKEHTYKPILGDEFILIKSHT